MRDRTPHWLLALALAAGCTDRAPSTDASTADAPLADATDVTATDVIATDVTATDVTDAPFADVTATDASVRDALASDASPAMVNPLGLTPGVAVTRSIGALERPSAVDLSLAAGDIDYRVNLASETFAIRLPARFDPTDATRRYGLITYIDAGDAHAVPASYAASLDARDIIWIGGQNIGNAQSVARRMGVALLGALRVVELYNVDPSRVYVAGLSGGSRTASALGYLRQDVFRGFIGRVGAALPAVIPGWQTAGTAAGTTDDDYEVMNTATRPAVTLPVHFRTALMTQYGDFRRAENVAIYRYGHLNHGNAVRLVMRSGGHADEIGASFEDALAYLYHPALDVVWDRFEDGSLAANTDAGRTVAGAGFVARSGTVREERYAYNGASLGVMRLVGASEAEARETFSWRDPAGVTIDARLRAETMGGLNQRVAMHVVPEGTSAAEGQPGLHVYWGYGAPSRVELVGADGARHTLATWSLAGPHPMAMPTTVTSPQAGEGTVAEKTFWNAAAAPDHAGATLRFRGDDVRLVLSAVGFQLTFNRPVTGLATTYTNRVVTQSTADGEDLPVVLQGFWSEVETATVSALPAGRWRLVLANQSVTAGAPTGDALVDEVRVQGSTGAPAAPPSLRATASGGRVTLSWAGVSGAATYRVMRAPSSGALVEVARVPGFTTSYVDTSAASGGASMWSVVAVGADGASSAPSPIAVATL